MDRINIVEQPTEDERYPDAKSRLIGWFDREVARLFVESKTSDGENLISVNTGSQWTHEALYHTKGGRWVLHWWSAWQGTVPRYSFVPDEVAREWLLRNDEDEAAAEFFGPVEPERGPGRPEIGPAFSVRLGEDLTARLDRAAAAQGLSRAALLRQIVAAAV